MTMTRIKTIPTSVLKSMVNMIPSSDRPSFGRVFRPDPDRMKPPAFYRIPPSDARCARMMALAGDGVFGDFVEITAENVVVVNEHAIHAFAALQQAVDEAWDAYQDRLEEIPLVRPQDAGER